jgi:hypothetical protein
VVRSDGARPHGALRGQRAFASPPRLPKRNRDRSALRAWGKAPPFARVSFPHRRPFLSVIPAARAIRGAWPAHDGYRSPGALALRDAADPSNRAKSRLRATMPDSWASGGRHGICRVAAEGFVALPQKEGRKTMTHAFDGDDLFAPVSYGGGGGGRDPDGGGRGYGGWSRNNCRRPRGLAEGGTALSAFDVNCNGNPWDDISLGASLVGGGVSVAARSAVSAVISGVGIGASFAGEHWSREN